MKKGVSLFEWIFCLTLYGLIIAIFLLNFINTRIFILWITFIGILIEFIFSYITAFSYKGLPKGCMNNPTGFIEIHVENMCEGNRRKFMELSLDILLYAINKRKNIMIDTWLIRENHIKDLFGSAAEIYKPSIMQSFINFIFQSQYKIKSRRKCFRCIIYIDKLTPEQIEHILEQLRNYRSYLNKFK